MILQQRHATFITQSLKEIHSGRETGLIDTGPFTLKLLQQDIYHKLRKACSKFYNRHSELIVKYNNCLKILQQGISEPVFYAE